MSNFLSMFAAGLVCDDVACIAAKIGHSRYNGAQVSKQRLTGVSQGVMTT